MSNYAATSEDVTIDAMHDPSQSFNNNASASASTVDDAEDEVDAGITLHEILYSVESFHAIARPVTLTMVLSALSVVFINTEETIEQGEEEMSRAYVVWETDEDGSSGENLLKSIGSSLIIVSVICLMTFAIVLLYKYRCMKCLIGYMMFSSTILLGVLGGLMCDVAIEKYRIPIDKVSYYLILYNFAFVGTVAIFYQKGTPAWMTQGYLVATSVILAWQFSHFPTWQIWTLLVFLALYDLCAVLTPCGPLKALVGLMQQDDSPTMPGLLYEASLPSGVSRPSNTQNISTRRNTQNEGREPSSASSTNLPSSISANENQVEVHHANAVAFPSTTSTSQQPEVPNRRTGKVPLAIACLYKLPVISSLPTSFSGARSIEQNPREPLLNLNATETSLTSSPPPSPDETRMVRENFTPEQLCREVEVVFPQRGTKTIKKSAIRHRDRIPRYHLIDTRSGNEEILKCLVVDSRGRVFEEIDSDDSSDGEPSRANSIKLGLGDFIFYSVLVAKAAMYSFTTFIACTLVILFGLGATLVLLSVYHKALPALPISIFLGVTFYLLTRTAIEPWIEDLLRTPYYI